MKFSLVIPCYNEEKNIPLLIRKYRKFLSDKKNELILVNNGSIDQTKKVIRKISENKKNIIGVSIKNNNGFGHGLLKGFEATRGKYLLYSHADLEVDPKDILKLIKLSDLENKSNEKIFIKGHRTNKLKNNWSFLDIIFSYGLTIFSTILFRKLIYDIHAMPVLFNKTLLKCVKYYPKDFSIDLVFYLTAINKNYKIKRFSTSFNKNRRKFGQGSSNTIAKKIKGSIEQIISSIKILLFN